MAEQLHPHTGTIRNGFDRRTFLKASAGAGALLVVHSAFEIDALAQDDQDNPALTGFQFFTTPQARTVEAIAERIWPETDESPGAREAGVVHYIDRALAGEYAQFQLDYRAGIQALDALAGEQHERPFVRLTAEEQHALLERIDAGAGQAPGEDASGQSALAALQQAPQSGVIARQVAGLTPPRDASLPAFFELVYTHTMEGLFSDPIYGGNRGFVGWRAVNYPGAYYVFTEAEQQSFEPLHKPFQSIADI